MKHLKKSLLIAAMAVGALATQSAYAANDNKCGTDSAHISVVGVGEVSANPDMVTLSFIAKTLKDTPEQARAEIEKSVKAFASEIEKLNLGKNTFIADDISIISRYNYKDEKQTLVGYDGSRTVNVKLKDFSKISQITDLALKSGINQINGFTYSVEDKKKYQEQAMQMAIANAKEQAEILAKGFGVKITSPCTISLQDSVSPVMYRTQARALAATADAPTNGVYTTEPIQVRVKISATFAFSDK